jgi:hypothetical protein
VYVPLPLQPEIFPDNQTYRLNVFAMARFLKLDTARLLNYRKAVQAGFFTDWPAGMSH